MTNIEHPLSLGSTRAPRVPDRARAWRCAVARNGAVDGASTATAGAAVLPGTGRRPRRDAPHLKIHCLWLLVIGCWLLAVFPLSAQQPTVLPPGVAAQMMVPQPAVDNSMPLNVTATVEFDPPTVRAGEKTFYRVTITATQNAIEWPDTIAAPPELQFGANARGQLMQPDGVAFHPLTSFVHEVTAARPGHFTVPGFILMVGWPPVEVPAAELDVVETNSAAAPVRRLALEISDTNIFSGQPFLLRVILPASPGNPVTALRNVQFNGGAILADKLSTRQTATAINHNGQSVQAFIYETAATPMAAGPVTVSAQAFTAPLFSVGAISITSGGGPITLGGAAQVKPTLLMSDALRLNVRPLPAGNELPGFTGAMGKFSAEKAQLATNRLRVGEPVKLKFGFAPETNLFRFVPPVAPRSREWQIIAGKPGENLFTLIPQTDEATNTPSIPFCAFDFAAGKFYDLTIPAQPVTVVGEGLPAQIASWDAAEKKSATLKLSGPANAPGKSVASLKPLQMQAKAALWLLPVIFFIALWRWDERRRFLAAHPEIVWRRWAKRQLGIERLFMRAAIETKDDSDFFVHSAAKSLQIAAAANYRTDRRTMVGLDVLALLQPEDREGLLGEAVRKIFTAADARFSGTGVSPVSSGTGGKHTDGTTLLALHPEVERVLQTLEEKL
jgi:hypothetical protein